MTGLPSSTGSIPLTAAVAFPLMVTTDTRLKNDVASWISQAQAGMPATSVMAIPKSLAAYKALYNQIAAAPGIAAFANAQVQPSDAQFDAVTCFNATQNALLNVFNWILANFPKDTANYLQFASFNADGSVAYVNFQPSALTGLVTQLQALSATIN